MAIFSHFLICECGGFFSRYAVEWALHNYTTVYYNTVVYKTIAPGGRRTAHMWWNCCSWDMPPPHLFRCVRGQGSIQQPTQLNIQVCFSAKRTYTKKERKNKILYNIYINIIQGLSSLSLSLFFFLGGGDPSLREKTTLYSSSSPTYGQVYCTHTSAPLNVVLYTLQDSCRPIRTREREREMSSQTLFKMSIEKRSRTSQLVSLKGNVIIVRRSSILYLFFSYFPVSGRKEPAKVSIRWRFPCWLDLSDSGSLFPVSVCVCVCARVYTIWIKKPSFSSTFEYFKIPYTRSYQLSFEELQKAEESQFLSLDSIPLYYISVKCRDNFPRRLSSF